LSARWLLDVNALVGLLWNVHSLHDKANAWFARERPVVLGCAFTELSFIRISMADRTIAATFGEAEAALGQFVAALGPRYTFIGRLPPAGVLREQSVRSHKDVTNLYLCELAVANGARLGTLDARIRHPGADLIA
jgi:predicted nucleic acid-binding protein